MEIFFTSSPSEKDMLVNLVKSGGYSIDNYNVLDLNDDLVGTLESYSNGLSLNYNTNNMMSYLVSDVYTTEPENDPYYTPFIKVNSDTGNIDGYFNNGFFNHVYMEATKVTSTIVNNYTLTMYDSDEYDNGAIVSPDTVRYSSFIDSPIESTDYYYYATYVLSDPNLIVSNTISVVIQGGTHSITPDPNSDREEAGVTNIAARPYHIFDPVTGKLHILYPSDTPDADYQVSIRYEKINLDNPLFAGNDTIFVWNSVNPLDIDNLYINYSESSVYSYYELAIYSTEEVSGYIDSVFYSKTGKYLTYKTNKYNTTYLYEKSGSEYLYATLYPCRSYKPFYPVTMSAGYMNLFSRKYNLRLNLLETNYAPVNIYLYKNKALKFTDISAFNYAHPLLYLEEHDHRLQAESVNKFNVDTGYSLVLDEKFNIDYIKITDIYTDKSYYTYYDYENKLVPIDKSIIPQSNPFIMDIYYIKNYGYIDKLSISSSGGILYDDFNLVKNRLLKYYIFNIWADSATDDVILTLDPIINIETYNDLFPSSAFSDPVGYDLIGYMSYTLSTGGFSYFDMRNEGANDEAENGWGKEPIDGYVFPEELTDIIKISNDLINHVGGKLIKEDPELRYLYVNDDFAYKQSVASYIEGTIDTFKEFYRNVYYYGTYVVDIPFDVTYSVVNHWNKIELIVTMGIKYQKYYSYTPAVTGGDLNGVCGYSSSTDFAFNTPEWIATSRTAHIFIYPIISGVDDLTTISVDAYYVDNRFEEDSSVESITVTIYYSDEYGGPDGTFEEGLAYYNEMDTLGRNSKVTGTSTVDINTLNVTVENGGYGDLPYGMVE